MIPKGINENYLLSEIPVPWTIMGRELKPFSIGHWIALQRWDCWPPKDEEQFILGIILCSKSWADGLSWVSSRFRSMLDLLFIRWRIKKIGVIKRQRIWRTFNLYLEEHFFEPGFIPSGESGATTLPTPLHIKARLMSEFGVSEEAVMDYPLRRAIMLIRASQEAKGQITVIDQHEMKAAAEGWRESRRQFNEQSGGKN